MSFMMRSHLLSLSVVVRSCVADGSAVFVSDDTARELDVLAGLPWEEAARHNPSSENGTDFSCDRCGSGLGDNEIAERVTLADLALGWLRCSRVALSGWAHKEQKEIDRAAVCAELAVLAGEPHKGNGEGAQAAWVFIVEHLTRIERSTDEIADRHGGGYECPLLPAYRRELNAMRAGK